MKVKLLRNWFWLTRLLVLCVLPIAVSATNIDRDRSEFRASYFERFPNVEADEFVLGAYAIDPALRQQWEDINEFPPYEFALDEGQVIAEQTFPNGTNLGDCLGVMPVHRHPYFDEATGEVITLAMAINRCRTNNGLEKLSYQKQPLAKLAAYLGSLEHGVRRRTPPTDSDAAMAAYESGKAFFFTKRGQLNLSCADCHIQAVGKHLREQTLGPLLGVVNHYPVYGLRWGALGTLHQRFVGCIEQVRGEAVALQSQIYRELEYFLSLMSDTLPLMAPGTHR